MARQSAKRKPAEGGSTKRKAPPPPPLGNQRAKGNRGGPGFPGVYNESVPDRAFKCALLGATDAEIADIFGVSEQTINNWKTEHPDFGLALKRGKLEADAEMAHSLYHRGLGYTHDAVKIFNVDGAPMIVPYKEHYAPDTAAAKHWLNNRRPKDWRERVELGGDPQNPVRFIIEGLEPK